MSDGPPEFDRITWLPKDGGGVAVAQWPDDVRRCPACKALVVRVDIEGHREWHARQLAAKEHTLISAALVCAVCLYVAEGTAPPAVTVINGLAVCEDHTDRAMDTGELWRIIAAIRKEHT